MYFLVILICLTINYVWLKDFDRFSDAWFFQFRKQVDNHTLDFAQKTKNGWLVGQLFLYGVPLLIVGLLLIFVADVLFGLATMLVHILILLIAFDRTQPGKLATDFLNFWKQDDAAACQKYLQEEMGKEFNQLEGKDCDSLATAFSKQLTYRCFEKMFVVFFWYMVTGPLGVVFCYVTYQLRDGQTETDPEAALFSNRVLIRVLEWVPMRLLVLSFSLAGNFVKCFARLKEVFWDLSLQGSYGDLLYSSAEAALHGVVEDAQQADGAAASDVGQRSKVAGEIESLLALLERSQLIWLVVLALITVFGISA